jgi:folate-binding protein YgfZ
MISAEQYRALREHAGLVDRADRGVLMFTGADRQAFLHSLLTNDVQGLTPGSGCYAALLSPNGRMVADMRVGELGDATVIDVAAGQAAQLRDRFDQLVFSEDVQIEDATASSGELGVYGPSAARVLAPALGGAIDTAQLEAMPLYAVRRVASPHGAVIVLRSDDLGILGFDLRVSRDGRTALAEALRLSGAVDVEPAIADITRIEGGRPRFGADMDEEIIPLEAGIQDRAISLTKGCYVGQEIIIRVLHRGQGKVAKRLVGLAFEPGAAVPVKGDAVFAEARRVGVVTSAAMSVALGRPIALAYVHRDFAEPPSGVIVETGGQAQPAAVSRLPFVETLAASAH